MMKLYRPLCSDVTMRLAVDLSPDEDEADDVTDVQTQYQRSAESCDNAKIADKAYTPGGGRTFTSPLSSTSSSTSSSASSSATSSPFHSRCQNQMDVDSANHNLAPETPTRRNYRNNGHQSSSSSSSTTNSRFSWYSRQNTSDKTAKDIYNHEHGRPLSGSEDFHTVPLDPEFKRAVEEGGNDFKDVSLYDEIENQTTSLCSELEANGNFDHRTPTRSYQYSPGAASPRRTKGNNLNRNKPEGKTLDNAGRNDNDNVKNKRCSARSSDEEECEDDVEDDDEEFDPLDVVATGHDELPIDLDEDVDLVDKQVMSQSMIASYYGEIDEEELQRSMTQSMQVDEIPDEMSRSIAEEIHAVLLDDDTEPMADQTTQQLPFPYPFTLKHAGHLFDKSRHHFTAVPQSPSRSRTPSTTSRSTIDDVNTGTPTETKLDSVGSDTDTPAKTAYQVNLENKKTAPPEPLTPRRRIASPSPARHTSSPSPYQQSHALNRQSHSNNQQSPAPYQLNHAHSQQSHATCRQNPSPTHTTSNSKQNRDPSQRSPSPSCSGRSQATPTSPPRSAPKKSSVATMTYVSHLDLEVTHRGLHRFVPRHKDEMNIGIGDPIHVIKECDDLWCEGVNLRTGERGIFPAMYANDLNFLEESDDEEEYWKFNMRFLGSVEVTSHKGDETLVTAINRVAMSHKGNVLAASLSTLEINQYGIRMIDKSKEGHEKDAYSHFFALKNISFCGTHPKNNRYFAFITKHPRDYKFACHVFHGDRPTHRARDALGEAFKRFYQEYMAFTHPTEDIYME